jgi:hypothetical protein
MRRRILKKIVNRQLKAYGAKVARYVTNNVLRIKTSVYIGQGALNLFDEEAVTK